MVIDKENIYSYYFPEELAEICNIKYGKNHKCYDMQLLNNENFFHKKMHPCLSTNKSVIDQIDNKGLCVGVSDDGKKLINKDRRFVVLGAERPLFNTTVEISALNSLNNCLYNIGDIVLNYTIIIFHSMLHLKCFIDSNTDYGRDHDEKFLFQLINYTPSALFGHSLLPPVTLPR